MDLTLLLDLAGALLGLTYLVLEMKQSVWMWAVGMVMPIVYAVVLYNKGIYADATMEMYYLGASIYGLIMWVRHGRKEKAPLLVSRTPRHLLFPLIRITAALWFLIFLFLYYLTDSRVPFVDSFTTALSIVALWMLSRKYIEQWWVWFVVDLVSTALYIYKGIPFRAFLYALYTLMAIYGYHVWRRG